MGESLEEAVAREIREESNLQIKTKQLLWIHEFIEKPHHAIEFYFKCEVVGGELKKGIDPELETDQQMLLDLNFISLDAASGLHIEPAFIKEFCENGGDFFSDVRHIQNSTSKGAQKDELT